MKELATTLIALFLTLISFANYTGNIQFSQSNLNFTTLDGYDVVSLNNASYTEIVGAPQLPVVTKRFVIPANENYEIRDLVTTGDAIRVKLPNVDNTYLWIENHQKLAVSEHKPWKDANPSWQVSNELIPDSENGIYMFIESVADDRENFSTGIVYDLDAINCIKPINAQGNYDYIRSEYPKLDPLNTNLTDDRYFWNNITYTFTRTNENPSS